MRAGKCDIRIGTSGWHYRHWLGRFYPEDLPAAKMLDFYRRRFDTVEINNTFYNLPAENAFDSWRRSTQEGFLFAVKGSRFLTHMKKLKEPEEGLRRFLERVELLGPKLGPILFQLPPRWRRNGERLDAFLSLLPATHRYAFEFREQSWLDEEIYEILRKHNAAFCIYDIAHVHSPILTTADFTYVRLHGPGEKAYQGAYGDEALRSWADRIAKWKKKLQAVYFYFDNDQDAYAVGDAQRLRKLVGVARREGRTDQLAAEERNRI